MCLYTAAKARRITFDNIIAKIVEHALQEYP